MRIRAAASAFFSQLRPGRLLSFGVLIFRLSNGVLQAEPGPDSIMISAQRTSATDLILSGDFAALTTGHGFVSHESLTHSAHTQIVLESPIDSEPARSLTVLSIEDFLLNLPLKHHADTLIARCSDGWENSLTRDDLKTFQPYLVLLIDGTTPHDWPFPATAKAEIGDYFIRISPTKHPEYYHTQQVTSKDPSGIIEISAVNYIEYYRPFFSGPFDHLSKSAERGRTFFMNNCTACHRGPGEVGGHKSQRPWLTLTTLARFSPDYLKQYIPNPQRFIPGVTMTPFKLDPNTMDDLLAFLSAGYLAPKS